MCVEEVISLVCQESNWVIDSGASTHSTARKDLFTLDMCNDVVAKVNSWEIVCLETTNEHYLWKLLNISLTCELILFPHASSTIRAYDMMVSKGGKSVPHCKWCNQRSTLWIMKDCDKIGLATWARKDSWCWLIRIFLRVWRMVLWKDVLIA